ncbi:MAG: hypothetical protein ACYTAN_00315 [Planctomycetota bacterium]|jgi:hypothetical protein
MSNRERELMREALLNGTEPGGELRGRFEEQAQAILRPRLSRGARVLRWVIGAVFLMTAPVFAYGSYAFAVSNEKPLVRVFGSVTFALGALAFLAAAYLTARQARRGRAPGRRTQKASVFIPYAFVLLYSGAMLMIMPRLDLPATKMIGITGSLLFFWIMVWGFVLLAHLGWHRQDILLEQKRTQLEVALLREELAGKA